MWGEKKYMLGTAQLESSSIEYDLGVLRNTKLNIKQCTFVVKKENDVLGCIRKGIGSQLGGDPAHLLRTGEDIPRVFVQFCAPQYSRVMNILQRIHSSMEGSLG